MSLLKFPSSSLSVGPSEKQPSKPLDSQASTSSSPASVVRWSITPRQHTGIVRTPIDLHPVKPGSPVCQAPRAVFNPRLPSTVITAASQSMKQPKSVASLPAGAATVEASPQASSHTSKVESSLNATSGTNETLSRRRWSRASKFFATGSPLESTVASTSCATPSTSASAPTGHTPAASAYTDTRSIDEAVRSGANDASSLGDRSTADSKASSRSEYSSNTRTRSRCTIDPAPMEVKDSSACRHVGCMLVYDSTKWHQESRDRLAAHTSCWRDFGSKGLCKYCTHRQCVLTEMLEQASVR